MIRLQDMHFDPAENRFLFVTGTPHPHDTPRIAGTDWKAVVDSQPFGKDVGLKRNQIAYMALTDAIGGADDPLLLNDYAAVLGLQPQQVDALRAFLEPWDKLRVCCGAQMSKDYRERLNGVHNTRAKSFHYRTNQTKASDMCEGYDINAVEHALIATQVFKTYGRTVDQIQKLSSRDMPFDGTYCSRSTAATQMHHFKMNDDRYRQPDQW